MPFWCARVFFFLVGFSSPAYFFFLRLSPVADDDDDGSGWCCCSFVLETNLEFQILLPRLFFPRAREMQRCVCEAHRMLFPAAPPISFLFPACCRCCRRFSTRDFASQHRFLWYKTRKIII